MATEVDEHIVTLVWELNQVVKLGQALAARDYEISGKKERSRYPFPSAEEYQLAESRKPLEGDHALNESWARILRVLRESLMHWWVTWDGAYAALKALPKQLVDDTSKPPVDRWSGKLSKLLLDVGGAVGSTRPDGAQWEGKLDLSAFVFDTLPDNWREQIDQIATYAVELQAIRNAGITTGTAQPPAEDGKRVDKQQADDAFLDSDAETRALAVMAKFPDLTSIQAVAEKADCTREHLSRNCPRFMAAWKATKKMRKPARIVKGSKSKDGIIEAWQDVEEIEIDDD